MKKLLLVLPVLALIAAGCNQPAGTAQNPPPVQTDSTTPPQKQNETAGWKTYANTKYGFEFKYPSEQISVSEDGGIITIGATATLITINTQDVGRESVFDRGAKVSLIDVNFAGKKAKEYNCPDLNKCPSQLAYSRAIRLVDLPNSWAPGNEINFDISTGSRYKGSPDDDYMLAQQILSTFKFTN